MKRSFLMIAIVVTCCLGVAGPQDGPGGALRTTDPIGPQIESPALVNVPGSPTDAAFLDMPVPKLLSLLEDPRKRVSTEFQVPEEIKGVVGFWFKIYAKYSLNQTLLYDRERPEIVYEVVDSRELFLRGLTPVALEVTVKHRVKRALAAYHAAFRRLAANPKASFATGTPGSNLLRIWGRRPAKDWRRFERALRTQPGQRDRIMLGLANAERFLPAMEAIFRRFSVPPELTRVPLVESSFNQQAISKARAVGVWQFLEKSAAEYLVVDGYNKIDERLSPIKSTYAAAKLLKRNHKILGDWGLAIIAYNHGTRGLIKIRKRYKGERISKLLRRSRGTPLGYASRSYLSEFIAMLHAERYRDVLYGMPEHPASDAISIIRMKRPASVFELAALYNISIHELRVFNPDIFDLRRKLPAGTRVVLPLRHGESMVKGSGTRSFPGRPDRGIASEIESLDSGR